MYFQIVFAGVLFEIINLIDCCPQVGIQLIPLFLGFVQGFLQGLQFSLKIFILGH